MASFASSRTGLPLGSGEDGQHSTLSDARDDEPKVLQVAMDECPAR